MRGIYICAGQDIKNFSSGITKKILNQVDAFKKEGFDIDLVNFEKKFDFINQIKFVFPFLMSSFEKELSDFSDELNWNEISFIYIRRITFCKGFIEMIKKIKKCNKNIMIIMEIPTYPLNGEYHGIKKILALFSPIYIRQLKKYIDRVVTYSNDEYIWNIETIRISNSVNFSEVLVKEKCDDLKTINMIAVAVFSRWHGYDRVINGLFNYYKSRGKRQVHLYLVGYGSELKEYQNLVEKKHLGKYVHILGACYGEKLDKIYSHCNIALDAMGRYRSNIYYNSSLKGKEYGAKGLPIISGVETELDKLVSYPYYYRVPNNSSPIDIDKIINYFDAIYKDGEEYVIDRIRAYNKKNFNFDKSFKPVIDIVLERCKE